MHHLTDLLAHRSAQYLASFGKQYIEEKPDDSHTNLEWDSNQAVLLTRTTKAGHQLVLHLASLRLEWLAGDQKYPLSLQGRSHGEVCVWLHHIALRCGLDEYDFYLHYKLNSGKMMPDHIFDDYNNLRSTDLITFRTAAQEACEALKQHFNLDTEIRVWPHHFDTGGYALVPGSSVHVGFGMAVPDSVVDDYYLYVTGYKEGKALSTEKLAALSHGHWKTGDFEGAVMKFDPSNRDASFSFLKEAVASIAEQN